MGNDPINGVDPTGGFFAGLCGNALAFAIGGLTLNFSAVILKASSPIEPPKAGPGSPPVPNSEGGINPTGSNYSDLKSDNNEAQTIEVPISNSIPKLKLSDNFILKRTPLFKAISVIDFVLSIKPTKGTQVNSKTLWKGEGKERIDVENPNPEKRPGQIHYQDNNGNKYIYDPKSGSFKNAPKEVNNLLNNRNFKTAIGKGLRYLGYK
jgi:hypothetical protein